jgi:hypothetical protein
MLHIAGSKKKNSEQFQLLQARAVAALLDLRDADGWLFFAKECPV